MIVVTWIDCDDSNGEIGNCVCGAPFKYLFVHILTHKKLRKKKQFKTQIVKAAVLKYMFCFFVFCFFFAEGAFNEQDFHIL